MADEWKEVVAEWIGESAFAGRNTTGGCVQMGSFQGQPGIGPMEMLLLGVAGCTGMDIVSILGKKRQKIDRFEVKVRGKRAESHPKVYTEIEVAYHLWGNQIDPRAVEQAVQLSEEKYCSASAMLSAVANMTTQYFLYNEDGTPLTV
jgi:putative redox protein